MKKLIFVIITSILISCGNQKPDNILSDDEMVNLMIAIHLTQAELQVRNFGHDNSKIVYSNVFLDSIIVKNGWSQEQVKKSVDYYTENIPEYSDVYERVLDSLTLKESLLRSN